MESRVKFLRRNFLKGMKCQHTVNHEPRQLGHFIGGKDASLSIIKLLLKVRIKIF